MPAALLVAIGAIAIALGAQVQVPMEPVPMTLQTLAVLGIGGLFGGRIGASAAALYLFLVLLRLPVLSGGSSAGGAGFLELKSAGYVVGFIPAAWVSGYLGRGVFRSLGVAALAHGLILLAGAARLARFLGAEGALEHGVTPFLWGAVVKTVVAAALVEHFAARSRRRGQS